MTRKVFISYSWVEPSGSVVNNWIYPSLLGSLRGRDVECVVDKVTCGYNEDIDNFEEDIVNATKVILVLSQDFLYSEDCMYEAALAVSQCNTTEQVYIINLTNYNYRKDEEGRYDKICDCFNNKKSKVEEEISKLPSVANKTKKKELRKINTILNNLSDVWDMFKSKNSGRFETVSKDNFKLLSDDILKRLEVCSISSANIAEG